MQQDHQHPYNDIFKQLLINPGRLNEDQMNQLQSLVDRFPQMGLLHALQARYSGDTNHLSRAAAGFADNAVLQKIVLRTSGLPAVSEAQIVFKNNDLSTEAVVLAEAVTETVVENAQPEVVETEPAAEIPAQQENNDTNQEFVAEVNEEQFAEPSEVLTEAPVSEPAPALEEQPTEQPEQAAISEELPVAESEPVMEEVPAVEPTAEDVQHVEPEDEEGKAEPVSELPVAAPAPLAETQQLIIENIAANDYFVFDTAFVDRNQIVVDDVKTKAAEPEPVAPEEAEPVNTEEGQVTRYHDDKMPYSFLWWLDKTRSKHSATYQPYVMNKPNVAATTSTEVTSATDKVDTIAEVPEERKKEDEILERFLQEDPQIKPPTGDKLDNENKARQSSEDQDEMITETLARIYADQMLYSKAIAAYKILILKNPEKRRYFANQIEILQKKIN